MESTKLLLDHGAQPKPDSCAKFPPLMFAVAAKCKRLVQLFIKHGCDIDESVDQSFGYLHYWTRHNDLEMVKFLSECGADINNLDSDNSTPLCIAVRYKNLDMMNFFLEKGACVHDKAKMGHSALFEALYLNDEDIFRRLLPYTENYNDINRDGEHILLVATKNSQHGIMRLLLEVKVEPDVTCDLFMTPLHYAVRKNDYTAILLLCEYQANACGSRRPSYLTPKVRDILVNDGVLDRRRSFDEEYDNLTPFDFAIIYKRDCTDILLASIHTWDYHASCDIFLKRYYTNSIRFLQFYVKTKVAGLTAYAGSQKSMLRSRMIVNYESVCQTELEKMKAEKLLANVSYHDFITSPKDKLVAYAKHQDVIDTFNGDDYKREFPVYRHLLLWTFVIGRRYVRSRQRSIVSLNELFKFRLPEVVSESLLDYISDRDVRMVQRALAILR
ncbi:ankyrin-1-like [Copidosoma floridanum]|uniref:ankyrin-1-like n=1 Tax=Copidosoma floridanum TaxID=29053 RepID=UPI0006C96A06|nr:ankyrin-1-like [Copidosoma floridanum]